MRTLLILSFAFVLGEPSFAQTDTRCGMPEGHPCRDFYTRFEAFKKLHNAEGTFDDAEGNLSIVERIQKNFKLNLEYTVDNFIYLQGVLGGAGVTVASRQTFELIAREITPNIPLHDLVTQFVSLYNAEASLADAQGDFTLIMKVVRSGNPNLDQSVGLFLSILKIEGGAGATLASRQTFELLLAHRNKFTLKSLFSSYKSLLQSEQSRSDAIGNFEIIILAAYKCGDLDQATIDFLRVLEQLGGAAHTSQARQLYRRLYEI